MAGRSTELFRPVGARLAELRKELGLTQIELARRLKCPQSYVSKLERAERRLDLLDLAAIAQATGVPLEALASRLLGR